MLNSLNCRDIKVLIVEDEPIAREFTADLLCEFFDDITTAVDGLDGLEKIKANNFDLLVTDINMPNLNGIEMLEEIKKSHKELYTIVITANSDHKHFAHTIKLGVKGYVLKPINIEQLFEVVDEAVKNINVAKQINILQQYKDIVDNSSIVSKTDLKGYITFVNDKFCEISGYKKEDLLGKPHNVIRHPDMPKEAFADLWKTIKNKKVWTGQVKNQRKDGSSYYVDATVRPILDHNGDIIEYIALRNDITEIISPKRQLLDSIRMMKNPLLTLIKLEHFSSLEHLYGEEIIGQLLIELEQNLESYLPEGCRFHKIINLENGEFALLKDMREDDTNATQKEYQLKQFQQNLKRTILKVGEYDFDISIIISFSTDANDIIENVKIGLENAITNKEDIIFANGLIKKEKEKVLKNNTTIKMIQTAIENKKIVSYFQPITNNVTMQVEKYESLVRLIDENDKVVSPFFFLDIAKKGRYYNKITNIVLEHSFNTLQKIDKEISINLSALDIEDLEIRNKLISLVMANMENAHRVVFELLEDEQIKDFQIVKDFISLVKTFGVQIAIDDFGAGVSNFERLLDYQPDILKIDACLIKNIDKDKYSRDVVETIQLFASKQNIKTVAEFVETEEILNIIKEIGIDYTQGYLLGKPQPLFF